VNDLAGTVPASPVIVFVALGSNLGDRKAIVAGACDALSSLATVDELFCSPLYETPPMGPGDQPDYINAVCRFTTTSSPTVLLDELQRIERAAGRIRPAARWSARTLDLDILLYADWQLSTPRLTIPHVGIAERLFVLRPLLDIDPDIEVPALGRGADLLAALERSVS